MNVGSKAWVVRRDASCEVEPVAEVEITKWDEGFSTATVKVFAPSGSYTAMLVKGALHETEALAAQAALERARVRFRDRVAVALDDLTRVVGALGDAVEVMDGLAATAVRLGEPSIPESPAALEAMGKLLGLLQSLSRRPTAPPVAAGVLAWQGFEWTRPDPAEAEFGTLQLVCRETGAVVGRLEGMADHDRAHNVYAFFSPPGATTQRATFTGHGKMPWLKAKEWVVQMATKNGPTDSFV